MEFPKWKVNSYLHSNGQKFELTDETGRKVSMIAEFDSMAFDIQVYSKENELIFEKDSHYAMPGLIENVQRHEEWTNFVLQDAEPA